MNTPNNPTNLTANGNQIRADYSAGHDSLETVADFRGLGTGGRTTALYQAAEGTHSSSFVQVMTPRLNTGREDDPQAQGTNRLNLTTNQDVGHTYTNESVDNVSGDLQETEV